MDTATPSTANTSAQNTSTNTTTKSVKPGVTQDSPAKGVAESLTGEKPQAEKTEPKRYKIQGLKVRGKEIDFDGTEDELKNILQKGFGSGLTYQEAKKMAEEAQSKLTEYEKWKAGQDEFKKKLAQTPWEAAIEAGADPKEIRVAAEKWLYERLNEDEMSPEARENRTLKQKLEEKERAEKQREEQLKQEKLMAEAAEYRKKIIPQFTAAMDAAGLPKTAANLSGIARRLQIATRNGQELSIEAAVNLQKQDNVEYVNATLGNQAKDINAAYKSNDTDAVMQIGREIESFLGEEVFVALMRYGIVKRKTEAPNMPRNVIDTPKVDKKVENEQMLTPDDVVAERKRRAAEWDRLHGIKGAATGL